MTPLCRYVVTPSFTVASRLPLCQISVRVGYLDPVSHWRVMDVSVLEPRTLVGAPGVVLTSREKLSTLVVPLNARIRYWYRLLADTDVSVAVVAVGPSVRTVVTLPDPPHSDRKTWRDV